MIVTVSRQYGAGGAEVASLVAAQLGWTLVDNQLIDEVAARAGLARDEVAEREERAPGFVERLARALARSVPEFVVPEGHPMPDLSEANLVKVTEHVVAELAAASKVVMVGRAAPAVLASHPGALHVRVVAPKAVRVERVAARHALDAAAAEKRLDAVDANRARYHREYYGRDWADPVNYHMTLNTAALGVEGTAGVVIDAMRRNMGG